MELEKQVDKSHYDFRRYVGKNHRWVSFYHQLDEIFSLHDVHSILEVGPGMPLVKDMLLYHAPNILYKSIDIAKDLNPDFVGSVTDMPVEDNLFDVVCAFQILEHIPYQELPKALSEIARVSKKHVLISMPHFGPALKFQLKIPMLPMLQFAMKVPYPIKHKWNGQHYWEIGKRGYSPQRIRKLMGDCFVIHKEYISYENQCHRFYILEVKKITK